VQRDPDAQHGARRQLDAGGHPRLIAEELQRHDHRQREGRRPFGQRPFLDPGEVAEAASCQFRGGGAQVGVGVGAAADQRDLAQRQRAPRVSPRAGRAPPSAARCKR
jgi:hypothetical protein